MATKFTSETSSLSGHWGRKTVGGIMTKTIVISLAALLCVSTVHAKDKLSPQNQRILDFIGDPVLHEPQDNAYSAETLLQEFKTACEKADAKLGAIHVDTSEYPYLIYGAWKEESKYNELRAILSKHKPSVYGFQGSVGGSTYFAVNITPHTAHPRELISRISRRTVIRMSVLANSLEQE